MFVELNIKTGGLPFLPGNVLIDMEVSSHLTQFFETFWFLDHK